MLNQTNSKSTKINLFLRWLTFIGSLVFIIFAVRFCSQVLEVPTSESQIGFSVASEAPIKETTQVLITSPILFTEVEYSLYYDIELTENFLTTISSSLAQLESAIISESYSVEATQAMSVEYTRLAKLFNKSQEDLNRYIIWETEHYYAAKTYEFLKQNDYSDAVACGIIGNMMVETSGGSLDLKPGIYSPNRNYYGLCQWSLKYYPEIKDYSFEYQLEYLLNNISYEFNTFGKKYKAGFEYEDFLAMKDPAEAALAFAKSYERCGSASYAARKEAALKAYEYFNLK